MSIYRRVLEYYRSFAAGTLIGVAFSLASIGLNLLKPWPFKVIVDYILPGRLNDFHPPPIFRWTLHFAEAALTKSQQLSSTQLIALLWPTSVVDFDTGLNTVIRKLRSALGDTSETPRYIETLPRRGYRFIGALDPDPEATSAASLTATASGPSPGSALPLHHVPTALAESALAAAKPMPSGHAPAVAVIVVVTVFWAPHSRPDRSLIGGHDQAGRDIVAYAGAIRVKVKTLSAKAPCLGTERKD